MTCMRDPVERIMSMYNFFKTQLFYFRPGNPDVDFYLWYINKDVLRPMLTPKQYFMINLSKFMVEMVGTSRCGRSVSKAIADER